MTDICARRSRRSAFSVEAHALIAPSKAEVRFRISEWFFLRGDYGATCEEAHKATGIHYSTMSARLSELKMDGILEFTGERRKTSTGCFAAVLRLVKRKREPEQLNLLGGASKSA